MPQYAPHRRPISVVWLLIGAFVVIVAVVALVAPAWTCAPFRLADLYDSGELPPPLPANCTPTSDEPSADTIKTLDSQREQLGLDLQGTLTCKVPWSEKSRAHGVDMRWFQNLYIGGVLRYRRHALIAATQEVTGGTLFVVQRCLTPWWKYIDESGTDCWAQAEFWK